MIVVLFSAALGAGILSLVICHPLWPSVGGKIGHVRDVVSTVIIVIPLSVVNTCVVAI